MLTRGHFILSTNKHNSREKTNRKKGGQKGHQGKALTKEDVTKALDSDKVDHKIIEVGDSSKPVVREQFVLDYKITPLITQYNIHAGSSSPLEARTDVIYGEEIKSLAVMLYAEGHMFTDKIASILREMGDNIYPISNGFIYNSLMNFSDKTEAIREVITEKLKESPVLYTDATSMPVSGKLSWIRNISNEEFVLYCATKTKNVKDLLDLPVLLDYKGNLIHDHETALYNLVNCQHFECGAHLSRRLTKSQEDTNNNWQEKLKTLLIEANRKLKEADLAFIASEISDFLREYDRIIELGYRENEKTKNKKFKKRERSLLNDLVKYRENYTDFITDTRISFTNNLSERDLRKAVRHKKITGGMRKMSGVEMLCKTLSITETLKKQKMPLLQGIKNFFKKV